MKSQITFLFILFLINISFGQKNFLDKPYIDISANVDTMVAPDIIIIEFRINKGDARKHESLDEFEMHMIKKLAFLGINTKEQIKIACLSNELNAKMFTVSLYQNIRDYELTVFDAATAGRAILELGELGIKKVSISGTQYSQIGEVQLRLRDKAVREAKKQALIMVEALGKQVGDVIYISDDIEQNPVLATNTLKSKPFYSDYYRNREELIVNNLEIQKIYVGLTIKASFELK